MAASVNILFDHPDLLEEIREYDVLDEYSPETVKRAQSYLKPGILTRVGTKYEDDGAISVSARIAGSRKTPYSTSIEFYNDDDDWGVDSFCSCPVGFWCKHCAALMMWLKDLVNTTASRGTHHPTRQMPREVSEWLRVLESAGNHVEPKKPPKKPSQDKFLAYCLEKSPFGGDKLRFALHPATRLKNGNIRIDIAEPRIDLKKPPKYFTDGDSPLYLAYQRLPRSYDGWNYSVTPEGKDGFRLIELAQASGRFFYFDSSNIDGCTPLQRGEPITVKLDWEVLPSGNASPVIRGIPVDYQILHVDPPLYIDPYGGVIGPLLCEQPVHLLKHWENGPEVTADFVEQVSSKITAIPRANLPSPIAVATVIRPDCTPIPHFDIFRLSTQFMGRQETFIVGSLSFQYDDSPKLPFPVVSDIPTQHVEMKDGTLVVWKRNGSKEIALSKKLKPTGLLSFSSIISSHLLHASLRSTFVPDDPLPTAELAWLRCLESQGFDQLRKDGWIINIDPRAGLTAHDVGEFLPAIEAETDHGIDWFRFDVSFEVDGVKRSLIPLIAQAIEKDFPASTAPNLPEWITIPCENPEDGFIRLPARRFLEIVDQVRHLFQGRKPGTGGLIIDRLAAAGIADNLGLRSSETTRALAELGRSLKDIRELPEEDIPTGINATLRPYQHDGFRWLRFLTKHRLNGILADDMGLGKTLQTLTHLAAEHAAMPGQPSLVVAPTSVVPNWMAEAGKFSPQLKVYAHHGTERTSSENGLSSADLVVTSYALLHRDIGLLGKTHWHCVILDEAQHIKNPKSVTAQAACALTAQHRICLSGTPMENHLGELWSLMRFLMPGYLPDEKTFNTTIRKPIERDRSSDAQGALNRRVSPLILRRTKDQVATDLPAKTEIIHHVDLNRKQVDLYESVRASMDKRVRDAIAAKGLAQSHIIVLDALLKLRQICCHPALLNTTAAKNVNESAKLDYLAGDLLPQLLEEGRRILLFSQFTSMLALIQAHLEKSGIPFLKLTGQTKDRASLVKRFQSGEVPIFLISLKAGGTGLNLTAADTVIHYDPWWNPAAENQATDRAHRIGQNKPVFVHKLVCRGSIEDRILDLQKHKSALVKALLSEETTSLRIDSETLSHLLEPIA